MSNLRRSMMMAASRGGDAVDWKQMLYCVMQNGTFEDIALPDGITDIVMYAFFYRWARTIKVPSSVVNVQGYSFSSIGNNSHRLERIEWDNPNVNLALANSYIFSSTYFANGDLDNFLPSGCTRIGAGWFQRYFYTYAIIPQRITQIDVANFQYPSANFKGIEFKNNTPPTLSSATSLGPTTSTWPIYVPDEAVSAYKTASENWQGYASRIKGISEKPTT